jgi:hypothetical protein
MHPFLQENPRRSTSFCRHENHAIYSEFAAGENGLVRIPAQIALALALLIIPCTPAPVATASATEFKEPTLSPAENPVDINTATLQLDRGIVTGEVYARIKSHIVAHRIQK